MDNDHRVPALGYLMRVARPFLHVEVEVVGGGVSLNRTLDAENFPADHLCSDILVLVDRDLGGLEFLVPRLAEFVLFLEVDPQLEPKSRLGEAHWHL